MRRPLRLVFFGLMLLAMLVPPRSTAVLLAQNMWFESYRNGLAAWEAKKLEVAEKSLKDAFAKNPAQGRNVRVPGGRIVYLPEYYLGLVYVKQKHFKEARVLLENVKEAGLIGEGHPEYKGLLNALDECRRGDLDLLRARTVKIESVRDDGTSETGSGIIVNGDKQGVQVVTALHVLIRDFKRARAPKSIKVFFYSGEGLSLAGPVNGEWLNKFDVALEMAAIRVTKLPLGVPIPSSWEIRQSPLEKQERVFTVGHAVEDFGVSETNVVLNPVGRDSRRFLVSTAGIGQGASGGPVIDRRGYLTGMMLELTAGSGSVEAVKISEVLRQMQP